MTTRSLNNIIKASLLPDIRIVSEIGEAIDIIDFDSIDISIQWGRCIDGNHEILIEESDDAVNWKTYENIAMSEQTLLNYLGKSRYLRASIVISGDVKTGASSAAFIICGHPHHSYAK